MDFIRRDVRNCMHAGGMIMGEMLTNSAQAFRYWKDKGELEFEFDICRTADGEYVTSHDFNQAYFQKHGIRESPENLTAEWFVNQNLFFNGKGPLQAMNLREVFVCLSQNQIERVMLDPKDFTYDGTLLFLNYLNSQIKKYEINPQRIIVELYNSDMIAASQSYPFLVTYQYCVDDDIQQGNSIEMRQLSNDELVNRLKENRINVISYPWKQAVENLILLKIFVDNGFVVYSRTRNNIFQELLEQSGVSVNIVDEILTEEAALSLQSYKKEYMEKYQEQIKQIYK